MKKELLNPSNAQIVEIIQLTKRETDCAKLLLKGMTAKEIASQLKLSYRTIEDYINNIKCKLRVRNKGELILKLLEQEVKQSKELIIEKILDYS